MNDIQVFNSPEFGEIRTVEIDGKPYFVGADVAKALGYIGTAKAIRTHCKGVSEMDIPSNGGVQRMKIIPEGDLYRLIVKSKLPSAEKFEMWVFDEVLPAIRNGVLRILWSTPKPTNTERSVFLWNVPKRYKTNTNDTKQHK